MLLARPKSFRNHSSYHLTNPRSAGSSVIFRGYATESAKPIISYFSSRSSCKAAGIVGLPNVGKSTFFNALTKTQVAQVGNFPFCTIEPNVARIEVNDPRMQVLSQIAQSKKLSPLQIEFLDIAGLVKGAAEGKGLGNQFLSNIRQVSAILQMVRCFEDDVISHVENSVDPLRDIEILNNELLLADYTMIDKMTKKATGTYGEVLRKLLKAFEAGQPASQIAVTEEEWVHIRPLQLLSAKPIIYCCNVGESESRTGNALSDLVKKKHESPLTPVLTVSAKIEAEIAQMDSEETRREYLELFDLDSSKLDSIVTTTRSMLKQITYFLVGEQETRAISIPSGIKVREAAGYLHTDFEKGFIKAEVTPYDEYVKSNGEAKGRVEGADYICKDGDIYHFRFK